MPHTRRKSGEWEEKNETPSQEPLLNNEIRLELIDPKAEEEAQRLLKSIESNTQDWSWSEWETWLSTLIAVAAAGGVSSSRPHFVHKLLEGNMFDSIREKLTIPIILSASAPSFLLSLMSNIKVWGSSVHGLPNLTREDFKKNAIPLTLTLLSAVVSTKICWDALKDLPKEARIFFTAAQFISALGTNGLFAVTTQNNIKAAYHSSPAKKTLSIAQDKLKTDPDQFIKLLSDSKLFIHLVNMNSENLSSAKENINKLFDSLFNIIETQTASDEQLHPPINKKREIAKALAPLVLGGFVNSPYFTSGKSLSNWLEFLPSWALLPLVYSFGSASMAVNTAISAVAIPKAMNRLFKKKSCPSTLDLFITPFYLYFLLGSGFATAGMALEYPLIENKIYAWITAFFSLLVALFVGDMSLHNFFKNTKNYIHKNFDKNYKDLLNNAKSACQHGKTLEQYYETLDAEKRDALVNLLEDYLKWAFESLDTFFIHADQPILDQLFEEPIQKKFEALEKQKNMASAASDSKNDKPYIPIPQEEEEKQGSSSTQIRVVVTKPSPSIQPPYSSSPPNVYQGPSIFAEPTVLRKRPGHSCPGTPQQSQKESTKTGFSPPHK